MTPTQAAAKKTSHGQADHMAGAKPISMHLVTALCECFFYAQKGYSLPFTSDKITPFCLFSGRQQVLSKFCQDNTQSVQQATVHRSSLCQGLETRLKRTLLPSLHKGNKWQLLPTRPGEVWTLTCTENRSEHLQCQHKIN